MSSLKEQLTPIKNELESLLSYANNTTGQADKDIGEAIRTLVDGYGQGGSETYANGRFILTNDSHSVDITYDLPKIPNFLAIYPTNQSDITASDHFIYINGMVFNPCDNYWMGMHTRMATNGGVSTASNGKGDLLFNNPTEKGATLVAFSSRQDFTFQKGVEYNWIAICFEGGGQGGSGFELNNAVACVPIEVEVNSDVTNMVVDFSQILGNENMTFTYNLMLMRDGVLPATDKTYIANSITIMGRVGSNGIDTNSNAVARSNTSSMENQYSLNVATIVSSKTFSDKRMIATINKASETDYRGKWKGYLSIIPPFTIQRTQPTITEAQNVVSFS